jgi:hypothetical protein
LDSDEGMISCQPVLKEMFEDARKLAYGELSFAEFSNLWEERMEEE